MLRRLFRLWSGNRTRKELHEEIEAHLAMRAEALEAEGLSPEEARREAERRFGDARALHRSARRRDRRLGLAERVGEVARDLRLAGRRARREPATTAMEVAIFALGVAITVATWTLVDRILLRPLPLPEPHRLVSLESVDSAGNAFPRVSMSNWVDWRDGSRSLEASGLHDEERVAVDVGDRPFRVPAQRVAGDFFRAVRMPLLHGRYPSADEAASGSAGLVVSEGFWRRHLEADPDLPREIGWGGSRRPVVGVVSEAAVYPEGTELWYTVPVTHRGGSARNSINWYAVGRLAEGATLEDLGRELSAVARGIRETDPVALYSYGVDAEPLRDFVVDDAREPLWLLLGAVLFVLLVAAANLAALNLARATGRSREAAVRRALGAGRGRLIRQELTRHLAVALVGGSLGIGAAAVGVSALVGGLEVGLPRTSEIALDGRAAAFGVGVSLLAGLLAALLPALRASTGSLGSTRSGSGGGGSTGRGPDAGGALVALEVGLAVLLVAGGSLLLRDLRALTDRDLGYDPGPVLTAEAVLVGPEYNRDHTRRISWWEEVLRVTGELPGVEAVGIAAAAPTGLRANGFVRVDGQEGPVSSLDGAGYLPVGGDYFRALSIPLLEGRLFDERDGPGTERVVVVNEALAERYWPDRGAPGQRIQAVSMEGFGADEAPWLTVIGVVGSVRHYGFQADEMSEEMYVLASQIPVWAATPTVLVRARGAPGPLRRGVERAVRQVDPSLAVETSLLADRLARPLAQQTLLTGVLNAFGLLAALLASLGVYGLISFAVSRRTREMGIRAALGARRGELVRLVVTSAVRVAGFGVLAGLVAAWWLRGLLQSQLYELPPTDPMTLAAAGLSLLAVSVAAALRPAWRAATLDPKEALREV